MKRVLIVVSNNSHWVNGVVAPWVERNFPTLTVQGIFRTYHAARITPEDGVALFATGYCKERPDWDPDSPCTVAFTPESSVPTVYGTLFWKIRLWLMLRRLEA